MIINRFTPHCVCRSSTISYRREPAGFGVPVLPRAARVCAAAAHSPLRSSRWQCGEALGLRRLLRHPRRHREPPLRKVRRRAMSGPLLERDLTDLA